LARRFWQMKKEAVRGGSKKIGAPKNNWGRAQNLPRGGKQ